MDEGGVAGVGEDPGGGGVDEEVEGVEVGHVAECGGEEGVEVGKYGGEGVYGDVEGAHVACDVGFAGEETEDGEIASGWAGEGDVTVEDALCDVRETGIGECECGECVEWDEVGDGEE